MKRILAPAACAAALLLSSVSIDAVLSPAAAQGYGQLDFWAIHDALAPYGDWVYSDRWGEVWIPRDVPYDFRPYDTDGYWAYTDDYGLVWVSEFEWGDIPFHYGRWVDDLYDGWLWIPGYIWSPAWVVWRSADIYVGWMPMPPDREFLTGGPSFGFGFGNGFGISFNFVLDDYYGYSDWYGSDYDEDRFASNWIFVDTGHLADRNFYRYRARRSEYINLIQNSQNITNYTVVNNYVVNRSVDLRTVQLASGHSVPVVHLTQIIKRPEWITPANRGAQIQARMRNEIPRGTGIANSAPKPPPRLVQSLSTNITPRNGRVPSHLFTRETVTSAPLPTKPGGIPTPPTGRRPFESTQPGAMTPLRERHVTPNGAPESQGPGNPSGAGPGANGPENMRRHEFAIPPSSNASPPPESERRRNEFATPPSLSGNPPSETRPRHEFGPMQGNPGTQNGATPQGPNGQGNMPGPGERERMRHPAPPTNTTAPSEQPQGNMQGPGGERVRHPMPPPNAMGPSEQPQGNMPVPRGERTRHNEMPMNGPGPSTESPSPGPRNVQRNQAPPGPNPASAPTQQQPQNSGQPQKREKNKHDENQPQ